MDYKIHHPPTGEGWADELFTIFKNLDCPFEDEEEEEELEEQPTERQDVVPSSGTAFYSLVRWIRSRSTLSLPEELSAGKPAPKRK